ncbi:peptidyl-lysine N-acetyltransferase YiaC-like [Ptychodera flava]|uniref:peptidyl-lysine N-acetyltransferase YiaC-like n=1 Tax=Ptychodera flava TaxID=63121 RepID=UPI00396A1672
MSTNLVPEEGMRKFYLIMRHKLLPKWEKHVAVSGTQLVGYIALEGNFVNGLFVLPEFQGRGIGRRLLDRAVQIHGPLRVSVYSNNTKATEFYEKYGFEGIEERHEPDFDLMEWIMEMPSAPSSQEQ